MTRHAKYYSGQSQYRAPERTAVAVSPNRTTRQGISPLPLAISFAVLVLAHLFDYTSFLVMVARHGIAAEANPIVVALAHQVGLPGLTIAKIMSVSVAALLVTLIAPHRPRLAAGLLLFGIAAGLVGGVSNVATL